jgi:diguanylate cyclase (GGDEF)-like protein
VSDEPRSPPGAASRGDARTGSRAPGPDRRVRALFPLSIRASLVIVMLIPLIIAVGLASTVVLHQSSTRHQAIMARQSSLVLDSLLRARVDVYAEYVPSAAIVAARAHNISGAELDSLLGVDFQADLVTARKQVDDQAVLGPTGALASDHAALVTLRRAIDGGTASPAEVETYFNGLGSKIDARWQSTFDRLLDASASSDSVPTKSQLAALGTSFGAFTAGLGEESLEGGGSLETVLTAVATPAEVQSLIVSHQEFEVSVAGFPATLGPKGTAAWKALVASPLNGSFSHDVQLAVAVGLGHETPPFATNSAAVAGIGRSEVAWAASLTNLVLASSADLRAVTVSQASAATTTLVVVFLFMLLLILTAIGSVLILGGAVRRPLARIVDAATSVREGELELPRLDESGPRELSLAAGAFNEMSSTLRAVQAQAIALSRGELDDPVLRRSLPGRTGAALQSALSKLQSSVRASERQRDVLVERATRDSLTGLLNRGAALEALELDLATAQRSQGELVLTVFFIDLDQLKEINDSLGHDGGDEAIRVVADALRATTRASDVLARFGGDEFVVGWLGNRGSDAPAFLAERIGASVASSGLEGEWGHHALGCSIGVAVSQSDDTAVETLIARADQALYVAKADGRGQIRWFGSDRVGAGRAERGH